MVGGLIDPEAGLSPEVEVPDDLHFVRVLEVRLILAVAAVTEAAVGQRPGDFQAVALATAFVAGDGNAGRKINFNGESSHNLLRGRGPFFGAATMQLRGLPP